MHLGADICLQTLEAIVAADGHPASIAQEATDELKLAPEHHTFCIKNLAEPNDTDSIHVTIDSQLSTIPWHWDQVAKQNPFFAQLWAPLHDAKEDNIYGPDIFDGWEK